MSYAVIRTGGKQYRVSEGQCLRVEKLEGEVGQEIEFDDVLMTRAEDKTVVEPSELTDVKVKATIVGQGRGPKIHVFTFKRRKGSHRHLGHRQDYTEVRISSIA